MISLRLLNRIMSGKSQITKAQLHFSQLFFLFIIIFFVSFLHIYPQNSDLPFEDISVGEGIPTSVQNILQDRTGYLWFATWSGLYKYDGYNFTSYKHDVEDTTSIIDNTLSVLYEDKSGILWVGSRLGLERFNRESETFVHYTPNPSDTGDNESNQIWAICEDKNGMLWVGSGNGLYKFHKVAGKFIVLKYANTDPGSISHNSIQAIYEDKEGSIWIGTDKELDKFDFETAHFDSTSDFNSDKLSQDNSGQGELIQYWNFPSNRYKPGTTSASHRINSIIGDDNGIIWMGTNGGLVEFNRKTGAYFNYLFNPTNLLNRITSISQDVISGSIWVATLDGLFSFDKKSKKFTHYNSKANCVYSERSGTLWIGTNTEIKKLNRAKQPFKKYSSNDAIFAVSNGTEGILWIFTFNGWLKFEIRKDKFVPYSFGKGYLFYVWNSGDLSIRREKGGLYIQDTLGNITFSVDPFHEDYINSASFAWKTNDGYWAGFDNGDLDLWELKTNRILKINNFKLRINFIYEDSFGLLWFSTFMGNLFCYNPKQDTFIEFSYDPKNPLSISGRVLNQIYEDKKGRLWFATINGLNKYERSTKSFTHFSEKNGLPSNNIRGILDDDYGYLWINTVKGISKFDPETNHLRNYDASYGIEQSADVFLGLGCKTKNGEMYFPGAKGFTRFHPDSIKDNPFIPPIVITSFKKFDKPFPTSDEIHLPHNENFISLEFAALSYISQERNQYAYMMEGLDKDWVYSGTRRYASYPNLDPGEYVFRVKGSNNDGVWNEAGTSIIIIISPPLWKTIWAYIFYSLIILTIIYFTWKMQVKRIKMSHEYEMSKFEAEKLHEVDEMKSRFFANISHEFRTPLTLILGPIKQLIEIIKDEKTYIDGRQVRNDLKVVHKNANRLLGLVNQLLDISKLESGNMKLQTIPQNIIPLLKALLQSFCSYAERKKITLSFNSSENEIIAYIDKDKIEKIITNVLSNAFKFTPEGGRIEVTLTRSLPSSVSQSHSVPLEAGSESSNEFKKLSKGLLSEKRSASGGQLDNCDFVQIAIRDAGIGISKEKLPKIFDRFYQVDGSHTREQEGTGIGLSLTKELVELHKGKIEVESEEGKGTTFTISIPLGKEHLKPEEIVEIDEDKDKDNDEEKLFIEIDKDDLRKKDEKIDSGMFEKESLPLLLLVEDNADVRNYIKDNLKKDYRIIEGVDGEDGWSKSIEQIPDLIVSDVMMPKMDGFKLCEKLKTDERTSHIPVILLTAKAASTDKIEGFEIGADDYIMKPFEPDELRARIKNLIEQRKRIHEHFKKHGLFEIEEKNITPLDQKFLQKVFDLITQHISDSSLNVESLTEDLALSRSVLQRKILSLVGETPGELIRRIRLKKAANLIEQKFGNLSEISLEVGFNNPAYFSEAFKKLFGMSPSQYQQKFAGK